jgi:FkbH-like protein
LFSRTVTANTKPEGPSGGPPFCFSVAASFTAEPLEPVFRFWGAQLNASVEIRFAPFNQLIQTLLDPSSVFAANARGVNLLLARIEDLGLDPADPASTARAAENSAQLADAVRGAHERFGVPLIFCFCPASPAVASSFAETWRSAAARMEAALEGVPGVQYLSADRVARLYPVDRVYDPDADRLGKIPYTELYFAALGTAIVRVAHSLVAPPYKVIALDCDNTLWSGIAGEDGPTGISLDPARRALHEFMLEQRDDGMLLCLASKNNEADVIETFELNPAFPLQLRHFTSWRLNWDSKAENLESLAEELSLGLDSFIFVDDNPRECAEVEDAVPEVLSLALPENASEIPHFLDHVWAFDHPVVTEEDRNRNAYYMQTRQFGREMRGAGDLRNFIGGLALDVRFAPLSPDSQTRAAQMTQRTNQFNFTTVRRTEPELNALLSGGYECVTVDVSDRFGAYGIVGLLIWWTAQDALEVDTFLLSCRALGRGVEHRMLAFLAAKAVERGITTVRVRALPTGKNQPARQFVRDVAASYEKSDGSGFRYDLPAQEFRNLQWRAASHPAAATVAKPLRLNARRFVEYAFIARNLSTPARIVAGMRKPASTGADGIRMTAAERRLAAIWSDLLRKSGIRPADNFYDLGGHSLLAVLLTLRVREEFGIELPIDDVYSAGLTLAGLARKVETYQFARVSPEEYSALLAEIESMSDEAVLAALDRESAEEPA